MRSMSFTRRNLISPAKQAELLHEDDNSRIIRFSLN